MKPTRAGLYVRISDDKAEDAAGVDRQEKDCRAKAAALGWTVTTIYRENDTSAYKRRAVRLPDGSTALRVARPQFRQLLDDLAAGSVEALVAYDLDRVARDPRDLEDLIDVVERQHRPVASVTGSLNLGDDAGVTMARVMVAVANKSSRDTARRVTRKQRELAEQGRPSGGGIRSYGYAPSGQEVVDVEAEVLRGIAADVLAGRSLVAIASDLSDRGIPTVRGNLDPSGQPKPWHPRSVHAAITKPRVAGLREYHGQIVGPATWPAILDRDTWEQVLQALVVRGQGQSNVLQRWLTRVLRCGKCGANLSGARKSKDVGGSRYWCHSGRGRGGCGGVAIDAEGAEGVVEGLLLAVLTKPEALAGLRSIQAGGDLASLRSEAQQDQEQLAELATMWASRAITTKEYLAARSTIEERLQGIQHSITRSMPGAVRKLLEAGDIATVWRDLAPVDRREVALVVFPHGITIQPATGRSRFDPDRLVVNTEALT